MLQSLFLFLTIAGVPIAIAMSGASLIYVIATGNLPPFVVIHRMISGIDRAVARVLAALEEAGLADNTIVVCAVLHLGG